MSYNDLIKTQDKLRDRVYAILDALSLPRNINRYEIRCYSYAIVVIMYENFEDQGVVTFNIDSETLQFTNIEILLKNV